MGNIGMERYIKIDLPVPRFKYCILHQPNVCWAVRRQNPITVLQIGTGLYMPIKWAD